MRSKLLLFAPIASCGFLLAACDQESPTAPTAPTNVTQIVNVNVGGSNPSASPSPGASNCSREAIDSVRVNPFGYTCAAGVTQPNNTSGVLPVGCTAIVTATPKDKLNGDVSPILHGSQITWAVPTGSQRLSIVDVPQQPFNKNVSVAPGAAPGEFQLTATVCGVTGAWNGRVVP